MGIRVDSSSRNWFYLPHITTKTMASGERGDGGPGPPRGREDKQSTPNKEGGNMEKEKDGRTGQAWWRRTTVHRESIFKEGIHRLWFCAILLNLEYVMLHLFQENKSYGVKTILIDLLTTHAIHQDITSRTVWTVFFLPPGVEKILYHIFGFLRMRGF